MDLETRQPRATAAWVWCLCCYLTTSVGAAWQVEGDGCFRSDDGCFQSAGWPLRHVTPASCKINVPSNNTALLSWESWDFSYDPSSYVSYMTVNGDLYTPAMRMWIKDVQPVGVIAYKDELPYSEEAAALYYGWRLCLHEACSTYECPLGWQLRPDAEEVACVDAECRNESNTDKCCSPMCYIPNSVPPERLRGPSCVDLTEPKSVHDCQIVCEENHTTSGRDNSVIMPSCPDALGNWTVPECMVPSKVIGVEITGDCQLWAPNCIASPNFPGQYPPNSHCEIRVDESNAIDDETHTVDWLVYDMEIPRDYVSLAGMSHFTGISYYNFLENPPATSFIPDNVIEWTADASHQGQGFLFCLYSLCSTYKCPKDYDFNCSAANQRCEGLECKREDTSRCCVESTGNSSSKLDGPNGTTVDTRTYSACLTTTTTTTSAVTFNLVGYIEFVNASNTSTSFNTTGLFEDATTHAAAIQLMLEDPTITALKQLLTEYIVAETGIPTEYIFVMCGPLYFQDYPVEFADVVWFLGYDVGPWRISGPEYERAVSFNLTQFIDLVLEDEEIGPFLGNVVQEVKTVERTSTWSHHQASGCLDLDEQPGSAEGSGKPGNGRRRLDERQESTEGPGGPPHARRRLTGTVEWQNHWGVTCADVETKDVCDRHSIAGSHWDAFAVQYGAPPGADSWRAFVDDVGTGSILTHCCSCGGGQCLAGDFLALHYPNFCAPCPAGTYSTRNVATGELSTCLACPLGTSSSPGSTLLECERCQAGRYRDGSGSLCEPCAPGRMANDAGASACVECPIGEYQDDPESNNCHSCEQGTFSNTTGLTACYLCPQGYESEKGGDHCYPCTPGHYTTAPGEKCEACRDGHFSNTSAATACDECPPGRAVDVDGGSDAVGATECDLCPPGYEQKGTGKKDCDICDLGEYSYLNGTAECIECPPGYTSESEGSTACTACPLDTFNDKWGDECRDCQPGRQGIVVGLESCEDCAAGRVRHPEDIACNNCSAGYYQPNEGQEVCIQCAPGTFARIQGMAVCERCPLGRYTDILGATECFPCPNGTYLDADGQTSCEPCEPGYAQHEWGATACDACTAGKFTDSSGKDECEECPLGLFTLEDFATSCEECDIGQNAPTTGLSECAGCAAGQYQPVTGKSECIPCALGQYASDEGSTDCSACDVGYFADEIAMTACIACANISNRSGAPELWHTLEFDGDGNDMARVIGAVNESFCGCAAGSQPISTWCEVCGEGLACYGMEHVRVLAGYAWDGNGGVYDCKNAIEKACPGGLPGVCAAGRDPETVACAVCLEGMVEQSDGTCVECRQQDYLIPTIFSGFVVILFIVGYCLFDRPNQKRPSLTTLFIVASAGQFVTIIQQLGVISLIRVSWVEPLLTILEAVQEISFFDLQLLRPSCVVEMDPVSRYALRVFMVFVAFFLILVGHLTSMVIQHRNRWTKRFTSWFCAEGAVMLTFFVSIVSTMVGPLQCKTHPNDRQTVAWYPSVVCFRSEEHTEMLLIGISACFFPFVFLVATSWAAYNFPLRIVKGDTTFLAAWSFLFFRYNAGAYWYGPVVLARNALVAMAPILTLAVQQIMSLEVLLLASLVMLLVVMPWRVPAANYLDTLGHTSMLCVAMIAAFFVDDSELGMVSTISAVVILLVPAVLVASIVYGVIRMLEIRLKPFQFFLCHHKAGAGSFCRFMKMRLRKTTGVKTKIFIDTDDLRNLDRLFDVVAHQTGTLVVIHSSQVLLRPWCAGEITTAFKSAVRTTSVYIEGVAPPTGDFISKYASHVPDLSALTEFGIVVENIQEALTWLAEQAAIHLPGEVREPAIDEVCTCLVNNELPSKAQRRIQKKVENQPLKARVLLLADEQDLEAVSTALILRHLMINKTVHLDRATGFLWSTNQEIRPTVEKVILILTNGVFNEHIVGALRKVSELKASILPLMSTINFNFPSTSWMSKQAYIQEMDEETAKLTIRLVKGIFAEIAVDFQPSALSGTEATLEIKAEEVVERLFGGQADIEGTKSGRLFSGRSQAKLSGSVGVSSLLTNSISVRPVASSIRSTFSHNKSSTSSATMTSFTSPAPGYANADGASPPFSPLPGGPPAAHRWDNQASPPQDAARFSASSGSQTTQEVISEENEDGAQATEARADHSVVEMDDAVASERETQSSGRGYVKLVAGLAFLDV